MSDDTLKLELTCARLAALSDPIRLRILALIHRYGELCVCEMTQALSLPQPKISKHLAVLRKVELLRMRRDAQWVHYGVANDAADWLVAVLPPTLELLGSDPSIAEDAERVSRMRGRPQRCREAPTAGA